LRGFVFLRGIKYFIDAGGTVIVRGFRPEFGSVRPFQQQNYSTKPNFIKQNDQPLRNQPRVTFGEIVSFTGKKIKNAFEKPLTLIYMADTHSNTNAIPKLKTAVNDVKSSFDNTLLVHAGDYGLGTGDLNLQVELMNNLGVELATLGNHEFFVGSQRLAQALRKADFMTVVSNMKVPEDNAVSQLFKEHKIVNSTIKNINGIDYGFIGATSSDVDVPSYDKYLNGIKVQQAKAQVIKEVQRLEQAGINRIVLISHLGVDIDKEIAQSVAGIDVIVGGHTHTKIEGIKQGVNLFESKRKQEPVLILHSGEYGEYLGVSHLVFNKEGILKLDNNSLNIKNKAKQILSRFNKADKTSIESTENALIDVSNLPKEKEMSALLDSKLTLIAEAKKDISCDWPIWGANHLGSLTADAVRTMTGAQIALIQPGGLRRDIAKGPIYAEFISNQVIPFDTNVVKVKLTGKQILDALNNGASVAGTVEKPGLLQVSGLRYKYNALADPTSRVIPDEVYLVTEQKAEMLDMNKTYTVAFDKFLLKGGENFTSLKDAPVIKEYEGKSYATALVEFIEKNKNKHDRLYPDIKDRIAILNRPSGSLAENIMALKVKLRNRLEEKFPAIEEIRPVIRQHIEHIETKFPVLLSLKSTIEAKRKELISRKQDKQ
jgi:2',3'-cyclic-nucleotide 2'-phosphodiesterase (5'-nucleotidase family)